MGLFTAAQDSSFFHTLIPFTTSTNTHLVFDPMGRVCGGGGDEVASEDENKTKEEKQEEEEEERRR